MNAETRAKEIALQIFASGHGWAPMSSKEATALIAQALRQAQNDKLEEAAKICMGMAEQAEDEGEDTAMMAACFCLVEIEKLKKD